MYENFCFPQHPVAESSQSHGSKGAPSFALLSLPDAAFISCPTLCWETQWAISFSLFPCHSDVMDSYHILHLQAKKSHSSFINQEDAAPLLWFGMLFPQFSIFWNSTSFPLRTKTLYTVLWIKGHNMQQFYNAFWFVYIFPDFSQYPIFLTTPGY